TTPTSFAAASTRRPRSITRTANGFRSLNINSLASYGRLRRRATFTYRLSTMLPLSISLRPLLTSLRISAPDGPASVPPRQAPLLPPRHRLLPTASLLVEVAPFTYPFFPLLLCFATHLCI